MTKFTTIEDVLRKISEATRERPGQYEALIGATEAIEQGVRKYSIQLPPRYGKTDVARGLIAWCVEAGISFWGLIITTSTFLRGQAVDIEDMQAFAMRWGYAGTFNGEAVSPKGPDLIDGYKPDPRTRVVTATIQMFVGERESDEWESGTMKRRTNLLKLIREHAAKGKRLLIIADECHTMSQANAFGGLLRECVDAGAIVITMTGTFYRSDDEPIFGAQTVKIKDGERTRFVTTAGSTADKVTITEYKDQLEFFSNSPNFSWSLSQAWMENAICKLEFKWIEVAHTDVVSSQQLKLSEMTKDEAKRRLWKIVRDPKVIRSGVEFLVDGLQHFKDLDPKFRALVFCGNDRTGEDAEDNAHCRAIQKEIQRQAPHLHTQIVTGEDNDAASLIDAFRKGPSCDVLIVKQMGGVGLDVKELKVLLDLSTLRTIVGCTQRWLRGGTKHPKSRVALIIAPKDPQARELQKLVVTDNGGGYETDPIKFTDRVRQWEDDKKPPPLDTLIVDRSYWGATSDDRLREFDDDVTGDFVDALMGTLRLRGEVTKPQIAERLRSIPFKIVRDDESATPTNIADERERLKSRLRDLVEKILQGRGYAYKKIPDDLYAKAKAETWTELKKGAGLYGKYSSNELKDMTDIDDLRKLDVFAQDVLQKETLHGYAV